MKTKEVEYKTWCYWHHRCSDIDKGKPGTACTAHLNEGRTFKCPYESLAAAKARPYPCEDAKEKV